MKSQPLKFSDLVDLNGLEKPRGVLTVELGGAYLGPERVEQLRNKMSGFAEQLENNQNVPVSEVAGLVAAMNNALKQKLSPERESELLAILKKRFFNEIIIQSIFNKRKHYRRAEGISWEDVQAKLEASPQKLWSLNEMERTDGEPDVTGYDPQTKEYIFTDCSAESPEGRRNCVYDSEAEENLRKNNPTGKCDGNAVSRAAVMGVNLLTKDEYLELQTKGKFDRESWIWIETPVGTRNTGNALTGDFYGGSVRVFAYTAAFQQDSGSFRASLRV